LFAVVSQQQQTNYNVVGTKKPDRGK